MSFTTLSSRGAPIAGSAARLSSVILALPLAALMSLAGCSDGCPTPCGGSTPLCDQTSKACVQCLADTDCGAGQICQSGSCQPGCNAEKSACPGGGVCEVAKSRCVPCLPAMNNCGAGMACVQQGDSYACASGCQSKADCKGGLDCCGNVCVDVKDSNANCGACGKACGAGQSCCGAACVDESSDSANCGGCGKKCSLANAMAGCAQGACVVANCSAGFADCDKQAANGCEQDVASDPKSCGGCGMACPAPANGVAGCAASMCTVASCGAGFADCDKTAANGCEVTTTTDAQHCGACNNKCPAPANAAPACVDGSCAVGACTVGFGDCDQQAANGCETNLGSDANHCGRCGAACAFANASATCSGGVCALGKCAAGFADCDGNAQNGCEVDVLTDAKSCGRCGAACAIANGSGACVAGVCAVGGCNPGFADCDGNAQNGCEVNTTSDVNHCGRCGGACRLQNANAGCANSMCTIVGCVGGYLHCTNNVLDGCETFVAGDVKNCGRCGNACAPPNGSGVCSSSVCGIAACNVGFADCNTQFVDGCEVNTTNDVGNCGRCGAACSFANAAASCVNSGCALAACNVGFANCDNNAVNGCEINTTNNVNHCGRCGAACVLANAVSACTNSACAVAACNVGFANCDGNAANGCETNTTNDINNCSGCGIACGLIPNGVTTCSNSSCIIGSCNAGFRDCDAIGGNGCEINITNNVLHCGGCGKACVLANATPQCVNSACAINQCNKGYGDCDKNPANGCETLVGGSDLKNCGGCGVTCLGGQKCTAGKCVADFCPPAAFATANLPVNIPSQGIQGNPGRIAFDALGNATGFHVPGKSFTSVNRTTGVASVFATTPFFGTTSTYDAARSVFYYVDINAYNLNVWNVGQQTSNLVRANVGVVSDIALAPESFTVAPSKVLLVAGGTIQACDVMPGGLLVNLLPPKKNNAPWNVGAMAISSAGTLYFWDNLGGEGLYSMDPAGNLSGPVLGNLNRAIFVLALDEQKGRLFFAANNPQGADIGQITLANNAVTTLVTLPTNYPTSLLWDCNGTLLYGETQVANGVVTGQRFNYLSVP